ncbi:hypothetical protein COV82_04910 [Candidatus Peregrinibacteria bacterium CG11_big_fil_rev_8_21_14_0_20_46_8]|nr:MAG: hypothetical protein COV82_04910 [Candidatus Peregrinibacteria bacterium CG11_big_fil_rev_8_21_14_0_20_46_8]
MGNCNYIAPHQLSDSELYQKCKAYGLNARQWMRKFVGLLPEVQKRRLYKRRGCASIYEFAAKVAGMNYATVDRVLKIAKRLEDKPKLRELFERGEIGWSKLEKVAAIATSEGDSFWAEKVQELNFHALDIFVQTVRKQELEQKMAKIDTDNKTYYFAHFGAEAIPEGTDQTIQLTQSQPDDLSEYFVGEVPNIKLHSDSERDQHLYYPQPSYHLSVKIDRDTEHKLRLIQKIMECAKREKISFAEVLNELIQSYQQCPAHGKTPPREIKLSQASIISSKNAASAKQPILENEQEYDHSIVTREQERAAQNKTTRYIPADIKRLILKRQNNRCAWPKCTRPPEIFHHTRRFALNKNHDPNFIRALCTAHERIVQSGLIENEAAPPDQWRMIFDADHTTPEAQIDAKTNRYRREPQHVNQLKTHNNENSRAPP